MTAPGRNDSKYVRKMHYGRYPLSTRPGWRTRCGKHVLVVHTTTDPRQVTCKTCKQIWDLDPDWDPDEPEKENDDETE